MTRSPEDTTAGSGGSSTTTDKIKYPPIWGSASWVFMAVVLALSVLTSATSLTCERATAGAPANCVKRAHLLWAIPLPGQSLEDVRSAQLSTWDGVDDEGDRTVTFRIVLSTANGSVPLTYASYNIGWDSKSELVGQLNTFLTSDSRGSVSVSDSGWPTVEDLAVGAGLIVALFALVHYIVKLLGSWWRRLHEGS